MMSLCNKHREKCTQAVPFAFAMRGEVGFIEINIEKNAPKQLHLLNIEKTYVCIKIEVT